VTHQQAGVSAEVRELLEEIAAGRGPYKQDNYDFACSVIETAKENAKKVLALLATAPPEQTQDSLARKGPSPELGNADERGHPSPARPGERSTGVEQPDRSSPESLPPQAVSAGVLNAELNASPTARAYFHKSIDRVQEMRKLDLERANNPEFQNDREYYLGRAHRCDDILFWLGEMESRLPAGALISKSDEERAEEFMDCNYDSHDDCVKWLAANFADVRRIALAAHDQKVRAEVLESLEKLRQSWDDLADGTSGFDFRCGLQQCEAELGLFLKNLALGAEEKP